MPTITVRVNQSCGPGGVSNTGVMLSKTFTAHPKTDPVSPLLHGSYQVAPGATVQEPTFVPRSPGAPEGDGFLMFVVNWPQERIADLLILDTADIARGPIASVHLPIPLRMAFHNKYISGDELAQRAQP